MTIKTIPYDSANKRKCCSMYQFLDDFVQSKFVECSEANTFGTYEDLFFAEIGCSSDIACIGILDKGCDEVAPYRLCKKGFSSPSFSCIYKKKAYTGAYKYPCFYTLSLIAF